MKIIAFDLDGTALNTQKKVTSRTLETLHAIDGKNVLLIPSTGRIRGFIPDEILELSTVRYLITSNGATIYDREIETTIYQNSIPLKSAQKALDFLLTQDIYIEVNVDAVPWNLIKSKEEIRERYHIPIEKSFFLEKALHTTKNFQEIYNENSCIEKINLPYLDLELRNELWKQLDSMKLFQLSSSIDQNIEINHAGANKGIALKAFAEKMGVQRQDVFVIGDNGNDVEMLRYAGVSVAMGNATSEAMSAAGSITESCDDDGFALAVEHFLKTI